MAAIAEEANGGQLVLGTQGKDTSVAIGDTQANECYGGHRDADLLGDITVCCKKL